MLRILQQLVLGPLANAAEDAARAFRNDDMFAAQRWAKQNQSSIASKSLRREDSGCALKNLGTTVHALWHGR